MPANNELQKKVNEALSEIIPYLQADNGGIELIECQSHSIKLRFTGTCRTCDMQYFTFKAAIEETIKSKVPEITSIEIVK